MIIMFTNVVFVVLNAPVSIWPSGVVRYHYWPDLRGSNVHRLGRDSYGEARTEEGLYNCISSRFIPLLLGAEEFVL